VRHRRRNTWIRIAATTVTGAACAAAALAAADTAGAAGNPKVDFVQCLRDNGVPVPDGNRRATITLAKGSPGAAAAIACRRTWQP
jgi:hypothetical protein